MWWIYRVHLDWNYCYWNWKLKTKNWKYCSKIIFKCVNSIVGPILIFFSAWTVLWTVIFVPYSHAQWTHVKLLFTHKEKKKPENVKRGRSFQLKPNGLIEKIHPKKLWNFCREEIQHTSMWFFHKTQNSSIDYWL